MELTSIKTEDREVQLTDPKSGAELGLRLHLKSPDHPDVVAAERKWINNRLRKKNRNKELTAEELEAKQNRELLISVAGWEWTDSETVYKGEQPEFSPAILKEMLEGGMPRWFRDFLVEESEDVLAFFE